MFGAIQDAAIAALNLPAERIAQLTTVYHQRREWVLRRLAALRWPACDAQGTFFLWLGVPPGYRSQEFAVCCCRKRIFWWRRALVWRRGRIYSHQPDRRDEALSNALDRLARLALFSPPPGAQPAVGDYPADESITDSTILPSRCPALLAHAPSAPAQGKRCQYWMTPASSRSASRASCAPLERTGG